eukprot:4557516-Amphidinium_carterae.1
MLTHTQHFHKHHQNVATKTWVFAKDCHQYKNGPRLKKKSAGMCFPAAYAMRAQRPLAPEPALAQEDPVMCQLESISAQVLDMRHPRL